MKGKKIIDLIAYMKNKKPKSNPSKEEIEKAIEDFLYQGKQESNKKPDGIIHREWEEDGEKFSCWEITTGGRIILTGDRGMELFNNALKNSLNK